MNKITKGLLAGAVVVSLFATMGCGGGDKKKEEPKPDDKVTALETKIDYLVNRLNLLAVQTSKQKDEPTETVEDILASLVRGNKKEE